MVELSTIKQINLAYQLYNRLKVYKTINYNNGRTSTIHTNKDRTINYKSDYR